MYEALHAYFPGRKSGEKIEFRVQYVESRGQSFVEMCPPDVYAALLGPLASLAEIGDNHNKGNRGRCTIRQPNRQCPRQRVCQERFSHPDVSLECIIPVLGSRLRIPRAEEVAMARLEIAEKHRRASELKRAEAVFQGARERYCAPRIGGCSPAQFSFMAKILRAGGELYRWSVLKDDTNGTFAAEGIERMYSDYYKPCHDSCEVSDVLECYKDIIERKMTSPSAAASHSLASNEKALVREVRERNRRNTLFCLHGLPSNTFWTRRLAPALPLAARNGWDEVVSSLLGMGAKVNSGDEEFRTAISYCAELGLESYLKRLLDLGVDPTLADKSLRTPLSWAVVKGQEAVTRLLLESGANVESRETTGRTPLSSASGEGHSPVVKLLLDSTADTETVGGGGKSPLMYSAEKVHPKVVDMLIEAGDDVHRVDTRGCTARLWAEVYGNSVVVDALRTAEREECPSEAEGEVETLTEMGDTES